MPASEYWGLSETQARQRLAECGYNELPSERKRTLDILFEVIKEPMLLLLVGSALLYLVIGDTTEALLLLGSALVVVGINIVQDLRSTRALEALKDLTSTRALVLRDGTARRLAAREVVPDDLMLLAEGDRVAADALVLSEKNLLADESLLTGESVAVTKSSEATVLSGSLIVGGSASVRVSATGPNTELGKIGRALATVDEQHTPLEIATRSLMRKIAAAGIVCCMIVGTAYFITRGGLAEAILAGVALAMALLPEEFPVVLSVFFALGARRLSKRGILIRRLSAVEALGTVTTLCVDKTGTLTKNEMTVVEWYTANGGWRNAADQIDDCVRALITAAMLSSREESFDPMDRATYTIAKRLDIAHPDTTLLEQIPLSHERPVLTQIWKEGARTRLAMKGAPEVVLSLARSEEQKQLHAIIADCAKRGLRVLGVAEATSEQPLERLEDYHLKFLGFLAFADPLREDVPAAIQECKAAGVRVVMITGDHLETARAIAMQAGIEHAERVVHGTELSSLSKEEIQQCNVFARVTPTQKLEIVQRLREAGEIVVMTGDGVNDAPALKAAHIGVAMGSRGTDVAREAAAVVLTHDDFGSLVAAVRLGRRTYDNIKKAMYYIVAVHIPIAGLSLIPLLLGGTILLFPIHIVLLELLLDPMSTLVFESEGEESNVMQRPPRDPKEPIVSGRMFRLATLQGVSILIACGAVYFWAIRMSDTEARTLTFITLLLGNLCLALVNRSWTTIFWSSLHIPNRALWFVIGFGIAAVIAITQIEPISALFQFGPFHLHDWLICSAVVAFSLSWFELLKLFSSRKLVL